MNALIHLDNTTIGDQTVPTVNARELHRFLEVKSEFRHWIKNRIADFGFIENQDFVTVGKNLPGGGMQNDYFVTLDMAKELSMVERNEKGKQARQYFIECERRAKQPTLPNDPVIMMRLEQIAMKEELNDVREEIELIKDRLIPIHAFASGFDFEEGIRRQIGHQVPQQRPLLTNNTTKRKRSSPITERIQAAGLTVRDWSSYRGFNYGAVLAVTSGLTKNRYIVTALIEDGYMDE